MGVSQLPVKLSSAQSRFGFLQSTPERWSRKK